MMNLMKEAVQIFMEARMPEKIFKHGGAVVKLTPRAPGVMNLTGLESKDRGKGDARAVVTQAIKFADDNDIDLVLFAVPDDDTDTAQLMKFYASFGFVRDPKLPFNGMTRKHH